VVTSVVILYHKEQVVKAATPCYVVFGPSSPSLGPHRGVGWFIPKEAGEIIRKIVISAFVIGWAVISMVGTAVEKTDPVIDFAFSWIGGAIYPTYTVGTDTAGIMLGMSYPTAPDEITRSALWLEGRSGRYTLIAGTIASIYRYDYHLGEVRIPSFDLVCVPLVGLLYGIQNGGFLFKTGLIWVAQGQYWIFPRMYFSLGIPGLVAP